MWPVWFNTHKHIFIYIIYVRVHAQWETLRPVYVQRNYVFLYGTYLYIVCACALVFVSVCVCNVASCHPVITIFTCSDPAPGTLTVPSAIAAPPVDACLKAHDFFAVFAHLRWLWPWLSILASDATDLQGLLSADMLDHLSFRCPALMFTFSKRGAVSIAKCHWVIEHFGWMPCTVV